MAARNAGPRSVADATRFTSSTPHANTKSTPVAGAGRSSSSPHASSSSSLPRRGGAGVGASIPQETMEERVRRLRAAHLAAKQHNISRMDQVIGGSRRLFDVAHKFTVMGLIGFSGMSIYLSLFDISPPSFSVYRGDPGREGEERETDRDRERERIDIR